MQEILHRIRNAGLKLKPEKCSLFQDEVTFLGHVVNKNGVQPNPVNTSKISQWPTPKIVTEVRQFLGMASYYRRFIKDFSAIAQPLHALTRKNVPFSWTDKCQASFDELKKILIGPDIMAFPADTGTFILDTDACDSSIGAVLSQIQDNRERVIAYASRSLNKSERNYCVTDKELLAVRFFIEYFRQYLLGRHFTVRTDHQALVWLFKLKEPKDRIARWIEILSAYTFSIEYRRGSQHGNADSMSRCENPQDCQCPDIDNLEMLKCGPCKKCIKRSGLNPMLTSPAMDEARAVKTRSGSKDIVWTSVCGVDSSKLAQLQMEDLDIGPVYKSKMDGTKPLKAELSKLSPASRHYFLLWESLEIQNDILIKIYNHKDGLGQHKQLVTPKCMRPDLLFQNHDCPVSGHLGSKRTWQKTRQKFYWYGMREDISVYIQKCDNCAVNKPLSKNPRAPLGQMLVGAPLDRLGIDILGPLPRTPRNNRYILVILDYFTKWVEVFPIPDQTALSCAERLTDVISRFGCPVSLHSDQGRAFESDLMKELCKLLQIRKTRSSPRNPKCNGAVERFNKTLVCMIRAFIKDEETEWDLNLNLLAAAYRATPCESTGLSPNMLMLGREANLPLDLIFKSSVCEEDDPPLYGDYVENLRETLYRAHEMARKHLQHSADYHKCRYDAHTFLNQYEPGDNVLYLHEERKEGECSKLQPLYHGPYLVLQRLNDLTYRIQMDACGKMKIVHHNKLRPYKGDNPVKRGGSALKKFQRSII